MIVVIIVIRAIEKEIMIPEILGNHFINTFYIIIHGM